MVDISIVNGIINQLMTWGAPLCKKTPKNRKKWPHGTQVNNNLIDQGSPIYGDVSAVFSSKFIEAQWSIEVSLGDRSKYFLR